MYSRGNPKVKKSRRGEVEEVITRVSMSIKILGCVSIASLNYFWDDSEIASHILPLISRRRLKYSMGSRFLISKSTYVGNTSKKDPLYPVSRTFNGYNFFRVNPFRTSFTFPIISFFSLLCRFMAAKTSFNRRSKRKTKQYEYYNFDLSRSLFLFIFNASNLA